MLAERIDALLPQTQCRRCGFDGCRPYAEALARGESALNRCPPGGRDVIAQLAVLLAQLGEAESALWRLLAEQRKTQKRVNALKYNIIPAYDRTIHYIESTLEEEERNTLYQMKVLHERAQG